MTSGTSCLAGNALHCTSITENGEGVVVDQFEARLVEHGTSVCLSDGETNSIGESLSERSCCDFDAFGIMGFGMARRNAVNVLEATMISRCQQQSWCVNLL